VVIFKKDIAPEAYVDACDGKSKWICPTPPSPNEDDEFTSTIVESFPPSWCPFKVELIMIKDTGHEVPREVI